MGLVSPADADFLLSEAEKSWSRAESLEPGSSAYARARWTARRGDRDDVATLLRHSAEQEDDLSWPTFAEAALEPAFAEMIGRAWFKAAWFGYDLRLDSAGASADPSTDRNLSD
jgi:hypothetical protein